MEYIMDQTKLQSRTKLSPFDGRHMKAKPVCTIVRGKTVMRDGEIIGEPSGHLYSPGKVEQDHGNQILKTR